MSEQNQFKKFSTDLKIILLLQHNLDAFADSSERLGSSEVKQRMDLCFLSLEFFTQFNQQLPTLVTVIFLFTAQLLG